MDIIDIQLRLIMFLCC